VRQSSQSRVNRHLRRGQPEPGTPAGLPDGLDGCAGIAGCGIQADEHLQAFERPANQDRLSWREGEDDTVRAGHATRRLGAGAARADENGGRRGNHQGKRSIPQGV